MAGICERFTANIISKIVKKTDEERCPIFSVLLKIAATLPVTSYKYERSYQ